MTTATHDTAPARRPSGRPALRFAVAFLAGLVAVLSLGAGVLYAYDREYEGRILPGVRVGSVDLSGLYPDEARDRLSSSFAPVGEGDLVLTDGDREIVVPLRDLGRRIDVDGLVAAALEMGRSGGPVERAIGGAKTALRGAALEPRVLFDAETVAKRIEAAAAQFDRPAADASIVVTETGFELTSGGDGAVADRRAPIAQAMTALDALELPARLEIAVPVSRVEPRFTTAEAEAGKAAAERIARDLTVTVGEERWVIEGATIRSWLRVSPTVDDRYVPVLQVAGIGTAVEAIAKEVRRTPKDAAFIIGDENTVTGVTAGSNGRRLDVAATAALVRDTLRARAEQPGGEAIEATVRTLEPQLTTEEAEAAAPKMTRLEGGTWTTYFAINEKNGFGANIWIPAEDIDSYVVAPGARFDFWEAVGPVTRERGYKDGGAIINGRTEPQGALAGGICSTSTTLFNAALRAGFEMEDRRNHFYYIERYPLGLDATVFKSSSGSVQTMAWRNDTQYPVLVRGVKIRDGNDGYVRFDLYSVPNGRTVTLSKPIVKNVQSATDSVEYTDTLPAGERKRIESPVEGKDVWVTRTVRNADGTVLHQDTYFSKYARITGVVQVGTGS